MDELLAEDLLKLADEELFVGHVLTSVAGWGPELEINLAMSSMGQDEIGHAKLLYGLLAGTTTVNWLVYDRVPSEFKAAPLASVYTVDWATLVIKHLLYDLADTQRLGVIAGCRAPEVAEVAGRMRHEETFHVDYWTTWLGHSMDTAEGPERLQRALDELWPGSERLFSFVGGLADEDTVAAARWRWEEAVRAHCGRHGLHLRDVGPAVADGTELILAEMRAVYASAPGGWAR